MSKKANKINSVSVNSSVISAAETCCIPENTKPVNITRMTWIEQAQMKHDASIGNADLRVNECKRVLNIAEHALFNALNEKNMFTEYVSNQHRENTINQKIADIRKLFTENNIPFQENELRQKAMTALNMVETVNHLTVRQARTRNLTVSQNTTENGLKTDNTLISQTIVQYNGMPFGSLPANVKSQFNRTSIRKYNAVSCYYQQLINHDGQGIIADAIRQHPDNLDMIQSEVHEAVISGNLHESTESRFKFALNLYRNK